MSTRNISQSISSDNSKLQKVNLISSSTRSLLRQSTEIADVYETTFDEQNANSRIHQDSTPIYARPNCEVEPETSTLLVDDVTISSSIASSRAGCPPNNTGGVGKLNEPVLKDSPDNIKQHLSFLSKFLQKRGDKEPSKVVCEARKLLALRHFTIVHLPAVGATLILLSLYISQTKWRYPTTEQLNALQFAAKAHEALILVSLTDILLHRICHSLIEDDGIPLGYISAAFHLGSPISYLMSWELWSVLIKPIAHRLLHRMTGSLIILVSLMSIGSGPLSAIIMIPRQGWWHAGSFPEPYRNNDSFYTYFVNGTIYDTLLDAGNAKQAQGSPGPNIYTRPKLMLENLIPVMTAIQYMPERQAIPYMLEHQLPYNITNVFIQNVTYSAFGDPTSLKRPISLFADFSFMQWESLITATTPMSFVAEVVGHFRFSNFENPEEWLVKPMQQKLGSSKLQKWKQPLLAVSCSDSIVENGVATFNFYNKILNDTIYLGVKNNSALAELVEMKASPGPLRYRFLDLQDALDQPVSASILFGTRINYTEEIDETNVMDWRPLNETRTRLNLCLISAHWVQADVWLQWDVGFVQSQLDIPIDEVFKAPRHTQVNTDFIHMKNGWLDGIDLPYAMPSNSSYQQMLLFCSDNYEIYEYCLTVALAAHLTDALSQFSQVNMGQNYEPDPQNSTLVSSLVYCKAFAYTFLNSRATPVAFSVLLLHIFIVFIHIATILSSSHPWYGSSWGSIGQMLTLALRSKPPTTLVNVGGGVQSSQTWKRTAIVRSVGENRNLEIILTQNEREEEEATELDRLDRAREVRNVQRVKAGAFYN